MEQDFLLYVGLHYFKKDSKSQIIIEIEMSNTLRVDRKTIQNVLFWQDVWGFGL